MPRWGLYNGAIGKVISFHFQQRTPEPNPNNGDLPVFVVVDIPHYKGPVWHTDHPTYVPIPLCSELCNKGCCKKEYVPLQLCFATTIHKIQGLSIGPSHGPCDLVNPAEVMVVDVGNDGFEKKCPGTLYVALSRATTMGQGDMTKSAIYFDGPNLTTERLTNLTCCKGTNKKTLRTMKREAWVQYLDSHVHKGNLNPQEMQTLFDWTSNTDLTIDWLRNRCRRTTYNTCVD